MQALLPVVIALLASLLAAASARAGDAPQWSTAIWRPATAEVVPHEFDRHGTFATTSLRIGGGLIQVALPDGPAALPRPAILHWISDAAEAIAGYYRHFPVARAVIIVLTDERGGIGGGLTTGGRLIRINVGRQSTQADLDHDWVMTHEMVHLSFPDLDRRLRWMEEGLATYLEPIARARRGQLPATTVWGDLVDGLPKGQPEAGDNGLDNTPTWGRTYWGGAGFWLLADLRLREIAKGKTLDDALRAILAAGGDGSAHWSVEQVLAEARRATGTDVLGELYRSMGATPVPIDLPALWQRLGVVTDAGAVHFDDLAPQARLRLAITAPER